MHPKTQLIKAKENTIDYSILNKAQALLLIPYMVLSRLNHNFDYFVSPIHHDEFHWYRLKWNLSVQAIRLQKKKIDKTQSNQNKEKYSFRNVARLFRKLFRYNQSQL